MKLCLFRYVHVQRAYPQSCRYFFKCTVGKMAKFSELYKRRDENYSPAVSFTSCSVSVKADAKFILEKTYYVAGLCRVTFVLI